MKIFQVFVTIIGIVMSLGYFPQAYKIYKLKSVKEISLINYIILSLGTFVWFLYGVIINDITLILGFALGVVGSWTILVLFIKYRNKI
jgi:MtN3 and saliva related transmembrane protein